jgi:hypothetical protein
VVKDCATNWAALRAFADSSMATSILFSITPLLSRYLLSKMVTLHFRISYDKIKPYLALPPFFSLDATRPFCQYSFNKSKESHGLNPHPVPVFPR